MVDNTILPKYIVMSIDHNRTNGAMFYPTSTSISGSVLHFAIR